MHALLIFSQSQSKRLVSEKKQCYTYAYRHRAWSPNKSQQWNGSGDGIIRRFLFTRLRNRLNCRFILKSLPRREKQAATTATENTTKFHYRENCFSAFLWKYPGKLENSRRQKWFVLRKFSPRMTLNGELWKHRMGSRRTIKNTQKKCSWKQRSLVLPADRRKKPSISIPGNPYPGVQAIE